MKYQTISMKRFFSYERCNLLCSHSNGDIFTCENNMLFSRVKISCFRAKAHLVFHWCLYHKLLSLFIPMAFHSKKKMLRELKIILRPFDKAYVKLFKKLKSEILSQVMNTYPPVQLQQWQLRLKQQ